MIRLITSLCLLAIYAPLGQAVSFGSWSVFGTNSNNDGDGDRAEGGEGSQPPVATATVPLHQVHGTHHVHVYIGSPPQRQTLIVDTGSRLMAFPCAPCKDCGKHVSPYFDPAISQTDRSPSCAGTFSGCLLKGISKCNQHSNSQNILHNACVIDQEYTEGSSWTAIEREDLVWLGSENVQQSHHQFMELAVPYVFGCQTAEQGLFRQQYADGILGLAMHQSSIINYLYEAKSITRNAFSVCLTRGGGTLGLGGVTNSTHLHRTTMKFSPILQNNGWFALRVIKVKLGNICLTCNDPIVLTKFDGNKGTILDTGTTDSYLPQALLPAFQRAWKRLTARKYGKRKQDYTYAEFKKLPTLQIIFQGNATLTIPPRNYMEGLPTKVKQTTDNNNTLAPTAASIIKWKNTVSLTNRIYLDEPEGAVLGGNAMLGNDILFDIERRRVGIALADCHLQRPGVLGRSTQT